MPRMRRRRTTTLGATGRARGRGRVTTMTTMGREVGRETRMMMIWRMSDGMAPSVVLWFRSSFWSIDSDNDVRKSWAKHRLKGYMIPSKMLGLDLDAPLVGE